jgi:hypothetical protein
VRRYCGISFGRNAKFARKERCAKFGQHARDLTS